MARDPRPKPPRGAASDSAYEAYDRELHEWEERQSRRRLGLTARAIVSGAITVAGATADAGNPPNTEQLNESYTQQMERRRREALDDANNDQG